VTFLAVAAVAALLAGTEPFDRFPGAAPSYLVEVDGKVLWARAPDDPRAPASLAKILAALVALESAPPAEWLTVSRRAASATGSRIGLRTGEQVRFADAVAAMLIKSANDACLAVAEQLSGTGAAFASRMNRRAAELGLSGTRFVDPCGHDAPGQHTTARDLWTLARVALGNSEFRRLVALTEVRLETRAGRVLQAGTSNALLGRLPGADGVKTGFTPEAGKCVVVHAVRDGRDVLVVLLGAPDRWWTAAALVEKAFAEPASGD
jgi:D-alanyl-D-alanine carboxypeptidase (penicillin-binding protein 5/6)